MENRSWPVRVLAWCYRLLDGTRRFILNLLFFLLLTIFIAAMIGPRGPDVESGSALVLTPRGVIVEEAHNKNAFAQMLASWANEEPQQTELHVLQKAIAQAKTDDRIRLLVIDTSEMLHGGFSQLSEIKDALIDFKKSGKKIIARADWYGQSQYYLAAQADEIYLDPMGGIDIDGFSKVRTYFKGALDKLGVNVHVFRVGAYKSAVEPFIRDEMSEEDKTNTLKWMGALWTGYKNDVAAARKLEAADIQSYADNAAENLTEQKGDMAQLALAAKLVDGLKNRIEFEEYITQITGKNSAGDNYKNVDAVAYEKSLEKKEFAANKASVGIIVAQGEIIDGHSVDGAMGGDTVAEQIRTAREDDDIKALVLRVDSPGGSAFASEVIRRELAATQQAGKPVIVSMSSVAASGGYWISASADEIFANPYTITGSIGIFGMLPTVDGLINQYGIHRDGIGTTKLSGALDIGRPLSPELGTIIQQSINNGYERFLNLVGESRKKTRDEVNDIAQGQVWDGQYASTIGLVDKLGNLEDAIQSAAQHAKLGEHYGVHYVKAVHSPAEQFADMFSSKLATWLPASMTQSHALKMNPAVWEMQAAVHDAQRLLLLNDPQSMYAHCMCSL